MQIRISDSHDLSELYQELDTIENDSKTVIKEPPPFRNEFFGVADIQEYLRELREYREYEKTHQSKFQRV